MERNGIAPKFCEGIEAKHKRPQSGGQTCRLRIESRTSRLLTSPQAIQPPLSSRVAWRDRIIRTFYLRKPHSERNELKV